MKMPFTLEQLRAEVAATLQGDNEHMEYLDTMNARPPRPRRKPVKPRKATKRVSAPICSQCKSGGAKPIVYGYPGAEAVEAADQGKVILGGCVLAGNDPHWQCSACGHRW